MSVRFHCSKDPLGEGVSGCVYRAIDTSNNQTVAIKKLKPLSLYHKYLQGAIREISCLKLLRHPNIVSMYDVYTETYGYLKENKEQENCQCKPAGNWPAFSICLVLEKMDFSLDKLIADCRKSNRCIKPDLIQKILWQLLQALKCMHEAGIAHNDLKPLNILINRDGTLKLTDFGLSEWVDPVRTTDPNTDVITRWYRPPELLDPKTCKSRYTTAVDIWSAGCVFAELIMMQPFLTGSNEKDQLAKICDTIPRLHNATGITDDARNLLCGLLTIDPAKRVTAADALCHPYFQDVAATLVTDVQAPSPLVVRQIFDMPWDDYCLHQLEDALFHIARSFSETPAPMDDDTSTNHTLTDTKELSPGSSPQSTQSS